MRPFAKVLIANRGEIVVRIARACEALGISTVAVYSDADRDSLHVRACNEAYRIGPAPAVESYLRGDAIIEVARKSGCDAIHPGFGFLSENAEFARAVEEAGITWIGPSPESIALMGSKIEAKRIAERNHVPSVPGYFGDDQSIERLLIEGDHVGYPLLVKASAGGGGKGMRVVDAPGGLREAIEGARREAIAAFGDDALMLEKYLSDPRHIEVQVLGDKHGNLVHLGERECSVQRRHQKVAEEAPSPVVGPALRERLTKAALSLARAVGYTNAGTVEFIYQDGDFYFLEMNTRLQVEHTVTEEAYGIDIVEAQLRIAAGEQLWFDQEMVEQERHAIEVRLYAEDPESGFLPSTGVITSISAPHDELGVRIDAGVGEGDAITPYYDPMIAKVITSGETRIEALRRMREVLGGLRVEGVRTNLDFLRWLAAHAQFELGNISTRFIERYYREGAFTMAPAPAMLAGAAVRLLSEEYEAAANGNMWRSTAWRHLSRHLGATFETDGHHYSVSFSRTRAADFEWHATVAQGDSILFDGPFNLDIRRATRANHSFEDVPQSVQLEMPGEPLVSIQYGWGDDDAVFVVWDGREYWLRLQPAVSTEHMNTAAHLGGEGTLASPMPGKVLSVLVAPGAAVEEDQPLVVIEAMKMEFTVRAPRAGQVRAVHYTEGDQVAVGDVLVEMET
jgi:3-methylcrotonyl-CoA carboxylase alpha subunit